MADRRTLRLHRVDRRQFLRQGLSAAPFAALMARGKVRSESRLDLSPDYGVLAPARDESTGRELLKLPEGFRYWSFGWTGDPLSDGQPTPAAHDGMAVVADDGGVLTLVRNHELVRPGAPLVVEHSTLYDQKGRGGTTTLRFDGARAKWLGASVSLAGTAVNCGGGPTPWGSWLSCEETVAGPELGFEKQHGWVFEVPATGFADARPLVGMGRFKHEAVAIDPSTAIAYETQDDRLGSGLYRFLPNRPGRLIEGGRLQMMKLKRFEHAELGRGSVPARMSVEWVEIDDPAASGASTFQQGSSRGGARFHRLEGIWFDSGLFYFTDTRGGSDPLTGGFGRVWEYDPSSERLRLIFESPSRDVINGPDNIAVSPRGGIVICEDSLPSVGNGWDPTTSNRLLGLTRSGRIFPFAENAMRFEDVFEGFSGDYRPGEWAGSCFSGEWLFANVQQPGVTFAITGPWRRGSL